MAYAGLTGDWQSSVRAQKQIFQPAILEELNDRKAKSRPNLTKFCRHDHKGLVNMSTEGINESLHGLGGIEEFPSKNGVFSKRKNVNSRELVSPSDLVLIEAVWIHHKELGKPSKSRAPKLVKPKLAFQRRLRPRSRSGCHSCRPA